MTGFMTFPSLIDLELILLPASSGRENRVTQDCERAFPELRPEAAGQRSIDAVDLENEVRPGTLLSLLPAVGCWVWVDVFLEQ